jgi:hypothetical protein
MSDQFSRRDVNLGLLAGIFAVVTPGVSTVVPRGGTPLFDFAVAGGSYHGLKDVRDELAFGERLRLRTEPANPHDPNAVAVDRADGLMLGYIPRLANEPVARLLERGLHIDAVVVERLRFHVPADIPDDFLFTGFTNGDPRIRLTLVERP